jgi:hypothetical protein
VIHNGEFDTLFTNHCELGLENQYHCHTVTLRSNKHAHTQHWMRCISAALQACCASSSMRPFRLRTSPVQNICATLNPDHTAKDGETHGTHGDAPQILSIHESKTDTVGHYCITRTVSAGSTSRPLDSSCQVDKPMHVLAAWVRALDSLPSLQGGLSGTTTLQVAGTTTLCRC